jgi:hypothetical protein
MTQQLSATVQRERGAAPFRDQRYSRAHAWHFDGGATVPASSSPWSVPVPQPDPAAAGRMTMTSIVLRPAIGHAGKAPFPAERAALQHEAHARCHVANSLRATITVEEQDV